MCLNARAIVDARAQQPDIFYNGTQILLIMQVCWTASPGYLQRLVQRGEQLIHTHDMLQADIVGEARLREKGRLESGQRVTLLTLLTLLT